MSLFNEKLKARTDSLRQVSPSAVQKQGGRLGQETWRSEDYHGTDAKEASSWATSQEGSEDTAVQDDKYIHPSPNTLLYAADVRFLGDR